MVEFDSIEAATRARDNLNGCDIYSACCTLKIDYAKVRDDYVVWHLAPSNERHICLQLIKSEKTSKLRHFAHRA